MAISESERHHLHNRLNTVLGEGDAAVLMSHLPPSGWSDVVRTSDLDLHLRIIDARFDALDTKISALEGRFAGLETKVSGLDTKLADLRAEMHRQTNVLLAAAGLVTLVGGMMALFS